jgi:hypothetical protein
VALVNAQHERNHFLRTRLRSEHLLTDAIAAQLDVPWRTNGLLAQIAFFALTCGAIATSHFLFGGGLFTGIVALVLAEYLIGARRWFFTGVESALWIGGVFALITELPNSGRPEGVLVLAAGSAIAGARVRNPLFGALAAIFVVQYAENPFNLGVVCALGIAFVACLALLRTWRRPTTEALWIALALILPIAGRFDADSEWRTTTIVLYAAFGIVVLGLAIARRHHALFLSAMIAFTIAGIDLSERFAAPLEAKLTFDGVLLLAVAFGVSRVLVDRKRGFVLTPIQLTPFDDSIAIAATLALQPTTAAAPAETQAAAGGGSFGGAGASGDY